MSNYKYAEIANILKNAYECRGTAVPTKENFYTRVATEAYEDLENYFITNFKEDLFQDEPALPPEETQTEMFKQEDYNRLNDRFDKLLNILNAQANASLM